MSLRTLIGLPPVPEGIDQATAEFLKALRLRTLAIQTEQIATPATTTTTGTPAPSPGPAGPPGPPGTPYVPDLTPPPTPSGVVVSAGIDFVFITTDPPTFTQGNGYQRTLVYGVTYGGTGPLPTFGDAVLVHEFVGQVGSFAAEPGVQWHIWLKWLTNDSVLSVSPQGGANGNQVTTGQDISNLLSVLTGSITTSQLASALNSRIDLIDGSGVGSVNQRIADGDAVLASSISTLSGTVAGNTAAISAEAVVRASADGFISAYYGLRTQVSDAGRTVVGGIGVMGTSGGTAGPTIDVGVVANKFWIAAPAGSSGVTDVVPFVVQTTDETVNGVVIPKGVYMDAAYIKNLSALTARLGNAWITNAMVQNLAASKLTAGSIAVGEYVQSSDFVTGVSGWRFGGNTAELGAASIRGQLTASQINANGLIIRDNVGVPILGAGNLLQPSYFAGIVGGGNLLRNSSFEVDTDADGLADRFSAFSSGSTGAITRSTPGLGMRGTRSQRIDAAALGVSIGGDRAGVWVQGVAEDVAVGGFEGSSVTLSSWFTASAQLDYVMQIEWLNSSAVAISTSTATTSNATSVAIRRATLTATVPTGAVHANIYFWMQAQSGRAVGAASLIIDDVQLELGNVATSWAASQKDKVGADNQITSANVSTYIASAAIGSAYISDLSADKINAGSLRGINVNASSHTTKGSYLTGSVSGGATTVSVKDTSDFAASGTAVVFDATNDRDQFTYTGKTSTTLTGCSGVLAHNSGATIIPLAKTMAMDAVTNEMRFYGDRGDGTIEELANIGIKSVGGDTAPAIFGSLSVGYAYAGVIGYSRASAGVQGVTSIGYGGSFISLAGGIAACRGDNRGTGPGVEGVSASGEGGRFDGNATRGHMMLFPLAGRPSDRSFGQFAMILTTGGGTDARTGTPRPMYSDGTNWRLCSDDTVFAG